MNTQHIASAAPAQIARGALRRLAEARREPTPANFAQAYAEESGSPAEPPLAAPATAPAPALATMPTQPTAATPVVEDGPAWAGLIERLVRGLERGGRGWTSASKKASLTRVLNGSRSHGVRLQQRLGTLMTAWESDSPDVPADSEGPPAAIPATVPAGVPASVPAGTASGADEAGPVQSIVAVAAAPAEAAALPSAHGTIIESLEGTVRVGLPTGDPRALELADELASLAGRIADQGATTELACAVAAVCQRARRLFGQHHELVDELMTLCRSLTDGMTDLAEDASWAQGQSLSLRARLDGATSARAVRAARELLDQTRARQRDLGSERDRARDALKTMIQQVFSELGDLDSVTNRFSEKVAIYAEAVEAADTLESLGRVASEMADESRTVHQLVAGARQRLADEHARASALESRVRELESDLRRLSDEVSTDALTEVANRRGLALVFDAECARIEQAGTAAEPLAVGLIDIDNFKKLNDTLGHAAGDVALKTLAARVKAWLRPIDHVARFGGEEFVVLLTATGLQEAQQVLTRLQRQLSASLFVHESKEVFVTFSAGVTTYRPGEPIEAALARADEGLYEAKRTGKNRTCMA